MAQRISTKRLAIDKANTQMVAIVAGAAFISIFCLIAAHQLSGQNAYLGRVVKDQTTAHAQLQTNLQQASQLKSAYTAFVSTPTNVIGGLSQGTSVNSGDNATIVLDALPSSYDFPALTSSLEKILTGGSFQVDSITGTDEELTEGITQASPTPQPISMPFTFSVSNASYASIESLIATLQNSIRPIQIDSLSMSGDAASMQLTVNAHTYYQPEKDLQITKEVVK